MASGFSGNMSHTLDAKGRVAIPAAYRELLGNNFTIALNTRMNAIVLYPLERWEKMSEQLDLIPDSDIDAMDYLRLVQGNAFTDQQIDGQGRILLPASLRAAAGLNKNIRFVGMGQFLEIWDEDTYTALMAEKAKHITELAKHVSETYFKPKQ